jgi:G3E family GTPase
MASWVIWIVGLLLTLFLANAIAACLDGARARRLETKFLALTRFRGKRLRVTVITGFLGSGKTSLLNKLLSTSTLRICVIENEKGSVSIDHALLKAGGQTSAGVVVLKNGCMCCTTDSSGSSELERVLDRLTELVSGQDAALTRNFHAIDYLVIETSGLADPAPILQTFFRKDFQERFVLDGTLTVVDAKHIAQHLNASGFLSRQTEAGRQVGYGDVILLNKVDVANASELAAARAAVRKANPTADVIECSFCNIDAAALLNREFFDVHRVQRQWLEDSAQDTGRASAPRNEMGRHAAAVTAITIDMTGAVLELGALQTWLQNFVSAHWQIVYRLKGLLWIHEADDVEERLFVVQGVHAELHGSVLSDAQTRRACCSDPSTDAGLLSSEQPLPSSEFRTALVIIGKGLDESAIRLSFAAGCESRSRVFQVGAHGAMTDGGRHPTDDGSLAGPGFF